MAESESEKSSSQTETANLENLMTQLGAATQNTQIKGSPIQDGPAT
jgi:hypothetical protein